MKKILLNTHLSVIVRANKINVDKILRAVISLIKYNYLIYLIYSFNIFFSFRYFVIFNNIYKFIHFNKTR